MSRLFLEMCTIISHPEPSRRRRQFVLLRLRPVEPLSHPPGRTRLGTTPQNSLSPKITMPGRARSSAAVPMRRPPPAMRGPLSPAASPGRAAPPAAHSRKTHPGSDTGHPEVWCSCPEDPGTGGQDGPGEGDQP